LVRLSDPELEFQRDTLVRELELLERSFHSQQSWLQDNSGNEVSSQHINSKSTELDEVEQALKRLHLYAPFDGNVVAVPDWLKSGTWISANTQLAEIASIEESEIRVYVADTQIQLLGKTKGVFHAQAGGDKLPIEFVKVSEGQVDVLADEVLSVSEGGYIPVRNGMEGLKIPLQGWHIGIYKLASDVTAPGMELPGYVLLPAEARSLTHSFFEHVYGVVLRESGF